MSSLEPTALLSPHERRGTPRAAPWTERMVVVDFETTGLSARGGDRIVEIGAVEIVDGRIGRSFQTLADPGRPIPTFVTAIHGITTAMVRGAPRSEDAMRGLVDFIADAPIVAHNAGFERGFIEAALPPDDASPPYRYVCTMRLARRLYPQSPDHRLGTLAARAGIAFEGAAHRALPDARCTARLLLKMHDHLRAQYEIAIADVALLLALQRKPRTQVDAFLRALAIPPPAAAG